MDRAVIEKLEQRRYTPAMQDGVPVETQYKFTIKLKNARPDL